MPDLYISPSRAHEKSVAKRFAAMAADGLLTEGNMAADYAARFLRCMRNAGLRKDRLEALRDVVLDAFGDVQGGINKTLDEEGIEFDGHQIDLSEVE